MNRRGDNSKQLKRNRRHYNKYRNRLLSVRCMALLSIVFVITLIFVFSSFADAHNENEKYYTSDYIESGQTLWDISEIYCSVEYADRMEYIEEVMELNHLTSEEIHSGNYLIVPYYDVKPL